MGSEETKQIIGRMTEAFEGEPWYGSSLMSVLRSIPFHLLTMKCEPSENSIARLTKHMLNWREFAIKKLEGDKGFDIELNSPADWSPQEVKSESEWQQLCLRLEESQRRIIELLSEKGDTHLSEKVPGKVYDFRFLIEGLIQHDVYHLGQISLIHRLLNQL